MNRRRERTGLLLLAACAGPAQSHAQDPPPPDSAVVMEASVESPEAETFSQLEGYVIAVPAGQRLPNSLVALQSGQETLTDLNGHFAFARLSPGPHTVMIVAPGCKVTFAQVDLEPWRTRRIGFAIEWTLEDQVTEVRRRSAEGVLVTSEDIDAMEARDIEDVIRRVAPDMVGRGRSVTATDRTPVVVINGVPAVDFNAVMDIRPQDVSYMEILKGAAGGWSYGSDGAKGLIRIVTKLGMDTDAPATDPLSCDRPDWP